MKCKICEPSGYEYETEVRPRCTFAPVVVTKGMKCKKCDRGQVVSANGYEMEICTCCHGDYKNCKTCGSVDENQPTAEDVVRWITVEGNGDIRVALNVALAKLRQAYAEIETLEACLME
jgi:hypothetical protein